jgi:hypothetical protein
VPLDGTRHADRLPALEGITMTSRCTICATRATRDLIDRALLGGDRPSEILRRYPDLVSPASLYRHSRNHKPRNMLTPVWLGNTTSGELIADLAAQRRSHVAQRDLALERGDHGTATREGHEAGSLGLALLKAGVENDAAAQGFALYERLGRAVAYAIRARNEFGPELAAAANRAGDKELSEDLTALAAELGEHNPKEQ